MALAAARPLPRSLAAPSFNLRLVVGVVLLGAAILGLVAVYRGAQPRTVDVLRAAHDLQPGQVLQLGDLQVAAEPLPDDVATALVAAGDRPTLVGRRLSQPLYAGDLVSRRQVEPITRQLAPGERLYTVTVSSDIATGLHLQSSDQVEIVVTTNKARPEQAETRVVLPNVTIFSVGAQDSGSAFGVGAGAGAGAGGSSGNSGLGSSRSTTIVLRTDDAGYQALAKAREVGDLDLALVGAAGPGQ